MATIHQHISKTNSEKQGSSLSPNTTGKSLSAGSFWSSDNVQSQFNGGVKQLKSSSFFSSIQLKKNNSNANQLASAPKNKTGIPSNIKSGVEQLSGISLDDVKVHYILTSALGDTVQNSYTMKNEAGISEAVPLQLSGGVIPGWSYVLPKMKKGGLYRVYIPWNLAYGEQQGRESLCFVIELIDHAKTGSFIKPEMNPNGQ